MADADAGADTDTDAELFDNTDCSLALLATARRPIPAVPVPSLLIA